MKIKVISKNEGMKQIFNAHGFDPETDISTEEWNEAINEYKDLCKTFANWSNEFMPRYESLWEDYVTSVRKNWRVALMGFKLFGFGGIRTHIDWVMKWERRISTAVNARAALSGFRLRGTVSKDETNHTTYRVSFKDHPDWTIDTIFVPDV